MKLSAEKISSLCMQKDISTSEMLREAGVSRNAYYSLARKNTVVPRSLVRIADSLGVSVIELLDESSTPAGRIRELVLESDEISRRNEGADRDNIRHTLILLDERPVDRLRRALRRGRSVNLR